MFNGMMWELNQSRKIGAAESSAARSASRATDAQRSVRDLEQRMDRLMLACMAMWELIRENTRLTEEDLNKKVEEIDLRDGRADGKVTRQVKECPQCGRVMSPSHSRCLYCGSADLNGSAFDRAQ